MRDMTAASTDNVVLSCSRFVVRAFTAPISRRETVTHTMNTAVPSRSVRLPLSSTKPVSSLVTFGMSMPTSVASSVSPAAIAMSDAFRQLFRYLSRSEMPSAR